jgi:hypothetical protein
MSLAILLVFLAAALAGCSGAGPHGYGYAVNGRPSLSHLLAAPRDSDSRPIRSPTQTAATGDEAE